MMWKINAEKGRQMHSRRSTHWQMWVHPAMDVDSVAYSELSTDKSLAKPIVYIWCDNRKMMQPWDSRLDSEQALSAQAH